MSRKRPVGLHKPTGLGITVCRSVLVKLATEGPPGTRPVWPTLHACERYGQDRSRDVCVWQIPSRPAIIVQAASNTPVFAVRWASEPVGK